MADPSTGNDVTHFPTSAPPRYFDNGSGAKLLQPANQVPYSVVPADLAAALVIAGIMVPSA